MLDQNSELERNEAGQPGNSANAAVRHVCTLCFKDGTKVSGEITTRSRYEETPVIYSGAVDRLPYSFATADSVLLRALFQSLSRELKAQFREQIIGEWSGASSSPEDWPANEHPVR
jgi:hypothetical protein